MKMTGKTGADPNLTVDFLNKLVAYGLGDAEFRLLHHWGQNGKLSAFLSYCDRTQRFRENENNYQLHKRLEFVLSCCDAGALTQGETFEDLAIEAFRKFPKS